MIKELNLSEFKKNVDEGNAFIVKFKSDSCPVCVDLKNDYEKVSKLFPDIKFFDVDVNKEQELSDLFINDGVPTLFYIKDKKFKEIPYPEEGFTAPKLINSIKKLLKSKK